MKQLFCPGNCPSSKNGRRWTGKFFVVSKSTKKWRQETKQWWIDNKQTFIDQLKGKEKPYKIGFHFVKGTRHLYDWVNPVQTIQDEMVTHGWIDDDNINEMVPVPFKRKGSYTGYSKKKPGVYIKVY